jgi:1-aminocyclopropane-1-carboxylate deaminase/D-cysteine desulfhydrase-like pyridoxal-dependent ACC family enzyme
MSAGQEGISVIAKGGVVRAAKGMSMEDNSFILPADVVAAMGNGSSQAGLQALRNNMGPGVQMIRGDGDGMSDSIPANIAGTQPALISDGEAYVPPGVVRAMGGGDMSKGAKNLYAVMDEARKQAYGRTKQANQIDPNKVMTKAMKA